MFKAVRIFVNLVVFGVVNLRELMVINLFLVIFFE